MPRLVLASVSGLPERRASALLGQFGLALDSLALSGIAALTTALAPAAGRRRACEPGTRTARPGHLFT